MATPPDLTDADVTDVPSRAGPVPPSFRGLERVRLRSAGHLTLSIDGRRPVAAAVVSLLDRVGARLAAALIGPIGGRVTVRVQAQADQVVLDVRSARPGTWTRALPREAFAHLLDDLSRLVARAGGTFAVTEGPYGRLRATARVPR